MTRKSKLGFKEYLAEAEHDKQFQEKVALLEHQTYKRIPGTQNSYREDPRNTNTLTQRHSHVYAKLSGKGNEVYSVNMDGSGHDGSSGREIPKDHATFFRDRGYEIPSNNILESLDFADLDRETHELILLEDCA